ncbi:hemolysin family protein [Rhodoluna lacicola]|uniref:Hemolysin-like protein containing CBS domains n=1 Tax=Rhodoluna lacicola TaxID=529884 RepID=A0A060JD09_9MICO|nr:hemolysin family protein [Rhodoluna lacicola]AIC47751.1 Hemolysin-like protein containing CBS domains [Rhodoluna lacicola]
MSSDLQGLVWLVVLLASNAFFVGAEFALISARRAQIEPRAEAGSRPAKITLSAMENVSLMLATAQLGITISSLLILLIAEPSIHHLLEYPLHALGVPDAVLSSVTFAITLLIVTYLHVVIGEMVPKNLALAIPERAALVLTPVLYALAMALKPLVGGLNAVSNGILRLFKFEPKDEANSTYTLDQVEDIVEHSTREGALSDVSGALSNTFEFTEKKVRDVAVPLDKLIAFSETVTPREVEQAVAKHGFSRYPLNDENNELVGYLHLKDVIDLDHDEADDPFPAKRVRSLITLSSNMELEDALASMRRVHAHMAKAVDRSGNIQGVLFLEDILEELVGEVQDATRR